MLLFMENCQENERRKRDWPVFKLTFNGSIIGFNQAAKNKI